MTGTARPLTSIEVLRTGTLGRDLMLHDGDGFSLFIRTNGKKLQCFRCQYPATKQRAMTGLGVSPTPLLTDIRQLRTDYLVLLANGVDPQIQTEITEEQR